MPRVTFDQALALSATEFHLLRERAAQRDAFDRAVERMRAERWACDPSTGTVRNRGGVRAQFTAYDWGAEYVAHPHFIFYDFFRPHLMNTYSRIVRGIDQ